MIAVLRKMFAKLLRFQHWGDAGAIAFAVLLTAVLHYLSYKAHPIWAEFTGCHLCWIFSITGASMSAAMISCGVLVETEAAQGAKTGGMKADMEAGVEMLFSFSLAGEEAKAELSAPMEV